MKKILCVFVFLFVFFDVAEAKQKICLNMIVKNETKVIKRCLESAKPFIDYWVIVDTGSTDGTQQMIKDFMKDIPGELHETPWKNFEYNRNDALKYAKNKGDYILFIDADEVFKTNEGFTMPPLDKDFYYIMTEFGGSNYTRVQLIKSALDWKWKGVLHEAVVCDEAKTSGLLEGIVDFVYTDGARSTDPLKYHKDAKILEEALKNEPDSTRYTFYLAQSYKDAGEHAKAIEWYQKRIAMGGWDQEIFWSMFQIAQMQRALKMPDDVVTNSYYQAYHYRPSRSEPLYYLANYYREKSNFASSYLIANIGKNIPLSKDALFVERWIHDYGMLLELSVAAYWIGKYEESLRLSMELASRKGIPEDILSLAESNGNFSRNKLIEIYSKQVDLTAAK